MGWSYFSVLLALLSIIGSGGGLPQTSSHSQPAAGSPSAPGPTAGGIRRGRGWREWRRGDPTLIRTLWKSKTPLGNAELYIVLALLIGLVTVVIGCWLSDNCWSPEPEHLVTPSMLA